MQRADNIDIYILFRLPHTDSRNTPIIERAESMYPIIIMIVAEQSPESGLITFVDGTLEQTIVSL